MQSHVNRKYIVKIEKEVQEFEPQNSLLVEANVAKKLEASDLSIPAPKVVSISEKYSAYAYEFIEGKTLRERWSSLDEEARIRICESLGIFHAEIGERISKEAAQQLKVKIDTSTGLHPEVESEFHLVISNPRVPSEFQALARKAKVIFDGTARHTFFQFLHNDAHHENILVQDEKISGIIDFGQAEFGEIAKEFSRYIRDFPCTFDISSIDTRSILAMCFRWKDSSACHT